MFGKVCQIIISPIIIFLSILLASFFPKKGSYFFLRNCKKERQRIEIKNAPKYNYNCEYEKGLFCTVGAIAGNFKIFVESAVNIVNELAKTNLVTEN